MKKICYVLFLTFGFTFANTDNLISQVQPKIGDELVINQQKGSLYNHVEFPRLNFVVKRGGLANYKSVYGNVVVVKEVTTDQNGEISVVLERKNGKKFFGYLKQVEANYSKSLESGELSAQK